MIFERARYNGEVANSCKQYISGQIYADNSYGVMCYAIYTHLEVQIHISIIQEDETLEGLQIPSVLI